MRTSHIYNIEEEKNEEKVEYGFWIQQRINICSPHGQLALLCKLRQMVCLANRASNFESFPSPVPKPQWWSYGLRNSFHAPPINQQALNGNKKNIWTIKRLFGGFFSVVHFSVKGGNKTLFAFFRRRALGIDGQVDHNIFKWWHIFCQYEFHDHDHDSYYEDLSASTNIFASQWHETETRKTSELLNGCSGASSVCRTFLSKGNKTLFAFFQASRTGSKAR